jgi:tetratricopeptide (TPR) repeat protein
MPEQWPPALREFARANAIPVTDYRFDSDLQTVVDALRPTLGRARESVTQTAAERHLLDTVNLLEVQAVESLERGDPAAARQTLDEGWDLLIAARGKGQPGPEFDVHLGYLYKASAQTFEAAGDSDQAQHHIGLAANLFSGVIQQGQAGTARVDDFASAVNGMGNVHAFRGEVDQAIADHRRAVAIAPNYAYAWHDLALQYVDLARHGRFDHEGMREAVAGLRTTGMNVEGLGPEPIEYFEVSARVSPR